MSAASKLLDNNICIMDDADLECVAGGDMKELAITCAVALAIGGATVATGGAALLVGSIGCSLASFLY